MNQKDKNTEYVEFWTKLSKNLEEILKEYNKLSIENKQRASMEAQKIVMSQGVRGILKHAKILR